MRMPTTAPAITTKITLKPRPALDRGTASLRFGLHSRFSGPAALRGACRLALSGPGTSLILRGPSTPRDPQIMILGIGIDLVDIPRLERVLERHGGRAHERLFTAGEVAYCNAAARPGESYAARFAAKEAFFKAVRRGWGQGVTWTEVEVVSSSEGAPRLVLHGGARERAESLGARRMHLSLTHSGEVAAAFLVLEG
jgi:holo-[acyl-carrier protein] synthase